MRNLTEDTDKARLVAEYIHSQYLSGRRGGACHKVTAAIRHEFTCNLLSTTFLGSEVESNPIIKKASRACRLNTDELRERVSSGVSRVKLPAVGEMMVEMRKIFWEESGWEVGKGFNSRLTYIASIFARELCVRVSEVAMPGVSGIDHAIRAGQVWFVLDRAIVVSGQEVLTLAGGSAILGQLNVDRIAAIEVRASSHKCGAIAVGKVKMIGRNSPEEIQLLEDLFLFHVKSGARKDDIFCSRPEQIVDGKVVRGKVVTRRMVTDAIQEVAGRMGLPGDRFASHSMKRGGQTDMYAGGASVEECNARGNYARGSKVGSRVYDFSRSAAGSYGMRAEGVAFMGLDEIRRYVIPNITRDEEFLSGAVESDGDQA